MPINIYRLARFFYKMKIPFIPKILKGLNYFLFNCIIPHECEIGEGTRLWHSGLGVIIHPSTKIGRDCNIYNFIVFGGGHDGPEGPPIQIIIGDRCNISSGSKILCKKGTLYIGNDTTIAANAVVVNDSPGNCLIAGIPAKIIKYKSSTNP